MNATENCLYDYSIPDVIPNIREKRIFKKTYNRSRLKVAVIHHDLEWFPISENEVPVSDKRRLYQEVGAVIRVKMFNPDTGQSINGWALIDGGADVSSFEAHCCDRLNLPVTKENEETRGAGERGPEHCMLYKLRIDIQQLGITLTTDRA